MSKELWSEWIEHDGKGCPVVGRLVHIVYKRPAGKLFWSGARALSDGSAIGIATGGPSWFWGSGWNPVIRYRTRIYRAGLDLIASINEPVDA